MPFPSLRRVRRQERSARSGGNSASIRGIKSPGNEFKFVPLGRGGRALEEGSREGHQNDGGMAAGRRVRARRGRRGNRRAADKIRVRNRGAPGCGNIRPPRHNRRPPPAPFDKAPWLNRRGRSNSYPTTPRCRYGV
ncbi:hypothetical protein KM043_011521 [Ampulex compressa]|nr:hypothetical protein KM043_011521 [Ampulex compressa]